MENESALPEEATGLPRRVEVLVVGAGPAGSRLAEALAAAGREVLLVEKRPAVGAPIRCAEAVERTALVETIGEPPEGWTATVIYGGAGEGPAGGRVSYDAGEPVGWVLNRRVFDRGLAARAASAGARVRVACRALGAERTADGWRIHLSYRGEVREVFCGVLAAADGVEGQAARWAGLARPWPLGEVHSCAQVRVVGLPEEERPLVRFYLGEELAPGGYGWSFPLGAGQANVGLSIDPRRGNGRAAREYLSTLLAERLPAARPVELSAGAIPAVAVPRRVSAERLVLVGDAAGHAEPLSGGGIANALQGAVLAGEVLAEALRAGDLSARRLEEYDRRWAAGVGRSLERYSRLRRLFLKLDDRDFDELLAVMERELERWRGGKGLGVVALLWRVATGSPRLALKLRHLL